MLVLFSIKMKGKKHIDMSKNIERNSWRTSTDDELNETISKLQDVYEDNSSYEKYMLTENEVINYISYKNNTKKEYDKFYFVTEKQMNDLVDAWENIDYVTDDIKQYCEINMKGKYAVKETQFFTFTSNSEMSCFDNRDGEMFGESFKESEYILGIMFLEGYDINTIYKLKKRNRTRKL